MNSRETKLNTFFVSEIGGDWGNEEETSNTPIKVLCIRGADIDDVRLGKLSSAPIRYIKEASLKKILTNKDIVIEISGGSPTQSTGRTALVTDMVLKNVNDPIVCSNFCRALRVKDEHCPSYVFYAMQNVYNHNYFFNFEGKTTGIKNLDLKSALNTIPVVLFSKTEQEQIAAVLSVLDSKIEINNRINEQLEAMTKTLYNYWFVQFDFPDINDKPYKSSGGKMVWNEDLKREIPEGWQVETLFSAMDVQYGFPFDTKKFTDDINQKPVVRIRDILENTISLYSTQEVSEKYKLQKSDLLIGMDGNFHMNFWDQDGAYLNQRSVRIRSKSNSKVSNLLAYFQLAPYIEAREKNVSKTTVGHLSDKDLKRLFVISSGGTSTFNSRIVFDKILDKIILNRLENKNLSELRDWLLPMLMNGQVKVK